MRGLADAVDVGICAEFTFFKGGVDLRSLLKYLAV